MIETKRKFNYRHIICIAITLGCLAFTVFRFPGALPRFWESVKAFGLSMAYYFCTLFNIRTGVKPTVNDLPDVPEPAAPVIPQDPEVFRSRLSLFGEGLISKDNFYSYISAAGSFMEEAMKFLVMALPFIVIIIVLAQRYLKTENNDYNKDSRPLKLFKVFSEKAYIPVKQWLAGFIGFIREHGVYGKLWLAIWLYNFNVFAIVFSFFAFYFYFVVAFDFAGIYTQVYKLFIDLGPAFKFIPVFAWVIIALFLFDRWRKKTAADRLQRFEMRDRKFIADTPIVLMIVGTMGKKKTTLLTDIALSQHVMFKEKALEILLQNDLKFPHFPWINLELELKRAIEYHHVYNLAGCTAFIEKKRRRFIKSPCRGKCFEYDYEKYGLEHDDKLKVSGLFEVLKTYAQAYFIYIAESSLIISNYSIREDNILADTGNFPMYSSDFFSRDPKDAAACSRHSHILDFDALRLGRRLVEDNIRSDFFEFGVVCITEAGKERGNMVENSDIKKSDDTANQKNDYFNKWLKMARHSATVDYFPFIKVLMDEQRPESLGADARDLCDIVRISESGDKQLAMPFFFLGELLYDLVISKFTGLYYRYRFNRSDNTFFMHVFKSLTARINRYYTRIYNRFSFSQLTIETEGGTMSGRLERQKYYLSTKKIYSKRFSTDCFSDYFVQKALRSSVGLSDVDEYETEKATLYELKQQDSYFINDLNFNFNRTAELKEQAAADAAKLELEDAAKAEALQLAALVQTHKDIESVYKAAVERKKIAGELMKNEELLSELQELKKKKDIA